MPSSTSAFLAGKTSQRHLIAHRCGGADWPENTIHAARSALAAGATVLQVDCLLTKDNVVVVMHDEERENNLRKLCGEEFKGVFAKNLVYSSLPEFSPTIRANALCNDEVIRTTGDAPDSNRFATLDRFLASIPADSLILLELWDPNPLLVRKVVGTIVDSNRQEHTVVGHPFDPAIARAIDDENKKHYPDRRPVNRILALREILQQVYLPPPLLPPPAFLSNKVFSVPVVTPKWTKLFCLAGGHDPDRPPLLLRAALSLFSFLLWCPRTVRYMRSRSVPTFAWVLNDEGDIEMGIDLGVDGIMTDYVKKYATMVPFKTKET